MASKCEGLREVMQLGLAGRWGSCAAKSLGNSILESCSALLSVKQGCLEAGAARWLASTLEFELEFADEEKMVRVYSSSSVDPAVLDCGSVPSPDENVMNLVSGDAVIRAPGG